jgi:hypothetical protein
MIHAPFYNRYIEQINLDASISELLIKTLEDFEATVKSKDNTWWAIPYEVGKWTPKELVMHLIDVERVYQFRAHCIAVGEKKELPGFDENLYVKNSSAKNIPSDQLIKELQLLRKTTLFMFKRFNDEKLLAIGTADQKPIDVEALGYIIAAHLHHHTQILKTRYL